MTFYNTDINFTSDADNKAAYVLANSKNMKPITKEKHPFLSLDAGASPQLPINNEYYDWFNRLHNEHKQDPINPPTIVVKNPLNGMNAIDVNWIQLQKKDKWFISYPRTVTQLANHFSNIENRVVDYKNIDFNDCPYDEKTYNLFLNYYLI